MVELRTDSHQRAGTGYGTKGARDYATARHGPDGAKFLDPIFIPHINNVMGKQIIDIGAGAGPWAIYAAQHGAERILGIEYQMGMLQQAKASVAEAGVSDKVIMVQADGASLPAERDRFSLALSINVGCNLPTTTTAIDKLNPDEQRSVGFGPHFTEMARVLEPDGRAVVTAPTSFGEVFTRGVRPKAKVIASIEEKLKTIGSNQDDSVIKTSLGELDDVYRATFARRANKWILVTDANDLQSGEEIWRKLPGLIVPNFYHSEKEYLKAIQEAGLQVVKTHHARFKNEKERRKHNALVPQDQQLGEEYIKKSPFAVFVLQK